MRVLTEESQKDIMAVYHELYCVATNITAQGVAVATHLHNYLSDE
jgi:hypothetical protein